MLPLKPPKQHRHKVQAAGIGQDSHRSSKILHGASEASREPDREIGSTVTQEEAGGTLSAVPVTNTFAHKCPIVRGID